VIDGRANYTGSAVPLDLHTHTETVVCRKQSDASYHERIVVNGPGPHKTAVLNQPSFAERLPNVFYGVVQTDGTRVVLGNVNGKLTFMRAEHIEGQPVRVRLYDRVTGEISEVLMASIDDRTVGQTVETGLINHDLDVLNANLPKNALGVTGTLDEDGNTVPADEDNPDQLTSQFPRAVDVGTPINIVFGETVVKCGYCNANIQDEEYDYMVGEGVIHINRIEKIKNGTIYKALQAVRRVGVCHTDAVLPGALEHFETTIDFPDWWIPVGDEDEDRHKPAKEGTYIDLWLHILTGDEAGRYVRIEDHTKIDDLNSRIVIKTSLTVAPGDLIEIQEWAPLINTVYKGRTAIRFGAPQDSDGAVIAAYCARYQPVRKNLLRDTDNFDPGEPSLDNPYTSQEYLGLGYDFLVDKSVPGPDDCTPSTKLTSTGAVLEVLEQTIALSPGNDDHMTFSLWVRTGLPFQIELFGDGTFGGSRLSTFGADGGMASTWRRIKVTKLGGFGTGTTTVTCRIQLTDPDVDDFMHVWGLQLEYGDEPTYYEPCGARDRGARLWSFPDAIQELLRDPTWGLGANTDMESFEKANEELAVGQTDTDWLFLRCQGSIPDVNGTGPSAGVDVLNAMLQVRGLRLRKDGPVWKLETDCPGRQSQATFGTRGTPYDNCRSDGPAQIAGLDQRVREFRVGYGQELGRFPGNEVRPYYPFVAKYEDESVSSKLPRRVNLQFVRDSNTAARYLQYTWAAMNLALEAVRIEVGQEGIWLRAGQIVTFISPVDQPENRLIQSNNLSDAAWQPTSCTVTRHAVRDPENENWRGTQLAFGASGYIEQQTDVDAAGTLAYAVVWAKASTPTNFLVALRAGAEQFQQVVGLGQGWKRIEVRAPFSTAASGDVTLRLEGSSNTVFVCDPQVTIDYVKGPCATEEAAVVPTTRFRIIELSRDDVDKLSLTLSPYDSDALHTYVKRPFPVKIVTLPETDPRTLPPDAATDVVVNRQNIYTAASGVSGDNGTRFAWAEIKFIMPQSRATSVLVQYRRYNEYSWTDKQTFEVAEVGLGTPQTVRIDTLLSQTDYEVRMVSRNIYGVNATAPVFFQTL
jgi:hypothetical protein